MKTWASLKITVPHNNNDSQVRTLCPQCSDGRKKSGDRCLSVDLSQNLFYCHHCGWGGGFAGETAQQAQKIFVKPDFKRTDLPENVIVYFKKRGISESTLARNHIGYGQSFKDAKAIQFPYYKNGEVVNIKHRTHDKRFRQEKDAEKCLYRFDAIAKDNGTTLIISEGEIDALSIQQVGFEAVASIPDGAPSADAKSFATKFDFLSSAEGILKKFKKVVLACDNDGPGMVAERELARRIGVEKCYRVEYPEGCKDANDVLVKHGAAKLTNIINKAKPYPVEGIINPLDALQDVLTVYGNKGYQRGVGTGWSSLDPYYTVKSCEMTIVTGIPSAGKSNFIDAMMINLAGALGWKFGVFSPENWPVERHLQTLLEKHISKPFFQNFASSLSEIAKMTEGEVKAGMEYLDKHFKFIIPKDELLSVDTILEKARVLIFRHGINGLVIDPWNELEHCFGRLTETQYISEQLTKIRRFARMNGLHVWVVAHPQKLRKEDDGTYKPPTMYEISGGAHWRNKADNGLCVHRPDYDSTDVQVFVQKIRFREVGKIGHVTLRFVRETGEYNES